jgi:hypothetical protein
VVAIDIALRIGIGTACKPFYHPASLTHQKVVAELNLNRRRAEWGATVEIHLPESLSP